MALSDIMEHTAVPVVTKRATPEQRVAGEVEHSEDAVPGEAFDCCLFLPLGSEDRGGQQRAGRQVKRPTLLWEVGPPLSPEDQLDITALHVTGPAPVRWKIDGSPQPFGRPGDETVGTQARLIRIED